MRVEQALNSSVDQSPSPQEETNGLSSKSQKMARQSYLQVQAKLASPFHVHVLPICRTGEESELALNYGPLASGITRNKGTELRSS